MGISAHEIVLQANAGVDFVEVAEFLAIPALFFAVGFIIGFAAATIVQAKERTSVKHSIAMIITMAWVCSMLASIAVPSYTTSFFIHAIMGAVAGYLFQREDGSVAVPGVGEIGGTSDKSETTEKTQ